MQGLTIGLGIWGWGFRAEGFRVDRSVPTPAFLGISKRFKLQKLAARFFFLNAVCQYVQEMNEYGGECKGSRILDLMVSTRVQSTDSVIQACGLFLR